MPKLNELEQRKQWHDVIDLIFDGPTVGQESSSAEQVTLVIEKIIQATARFLDFIAGQALASVAVPPEVIRAAYRSGDDDPIMLPVDDRWEEIGRKARNDSLSPEERRRVAIALLRGIQCAHPIFEETADALEALSFGEVKGILKPSPKGFHGIGYGHTAWTLRLRGLQCAEYLICTGKMRKTDAIKAVAEAFSLSEAAVRGGGGTKGWYEQAAAETHFGIQYVEAELYTARIAGLILKKHPVERNELIDSFLEIFEQSFGLEPLRDYGRQFKQLPRKLRNKK
jgi:hypothetical protein